MEFLRTRHFVTVAALLLLGAAACVDDGPANPPDATVGDAVTASVASDAGVQQFALPAHCLDEDKDLQRAPSTLECTGLFASMTDKALNTGVQGFTPAHALWSDGAEKHRWIYLPEGQTIDTSNPDAWSFPVGTRAWKEFKHTGHRVETRYFRKVSKFSWQSATYLWNQDESGASAFAGGDVPVSDGTYYVPIGMECEQCHRGSPDQLLGFQAVLLGLPGAEGVTLAGLAASNRLSQQPTHTNFTIPDDGTGLAAPALGWLHVNCGVSCHNSTPAATGGPSRMFLRINPTFFDAPSFFDATTPSLWDAEKTTIDVPAHIADFAGRKRIVPGSPEQSLLFELASTRGTSKQMPPIATKVVDPAGIKAVHDWIEALGKRPVDMDAAVQPDTGVTVVTPVADAGTEVADASSVVVGDDAGVVVGDDAGVVAGDDAGAMMEVDAGAVVPPAAVADASEPAVEMDAAVPVTPEQADADMPAPAPAATP